MKIVEYKLQEFCKTIVAKDIYNYDMEIHIVKYPTMNCQLSSFGPAENLLKIRSEQELFETIVAIIKNSNSQILLDIKTDIYERIVRILTPYTDKIIIKDSYQSPNESKMNLLIINWNSYAKSLINT